MKGIDEWKAQKLFTTLNKLYWTLSYFSFCNYWMYFNFCFFFFHWYSYWYFSLIGIPTIAQCFKYLSKKFIWTSQFCVQITTNKPSEYSMISLKNQSINILPNFWKPTSVWKISLWVLINIWFPTKDQKFGMTF